MTRNRLTAMLAVAAGVIGLPASAHASYADGVLDDDPLTYLRLDETTGRDALDASGMHNDGEYVGGVTLDGPAPFADAVRSVKLGTTGAITADVPRTDAHATGGSVELWVNPDRMVKNPQAPLVAHGNPATDGWALGIGDKRKLWWKSGPTTVKTKLSLGSGVWTALTLSWDGSKVSFYRNGADAKIFKASVSPSSSTGDLVVGGNGNGGFTRQFSGRVDEVALYQKALSVSDVRDHLAGAHVPINTNLPSIDGTAQVGETLTAHPGTWIDTDLAVYPPSYQWLRCDDTGEACVEEATGSTYLLDDQDKCSRFQVEVTVTNSHRQTGIAQSVRTDVVTPCDERSGADQRGSAGDRRRRDASCGRGAHRPCRRVAVRRARGGVSVAAL